MQLQFEKQTCPCLTTAVREVQNQEVTQQIRLSDGLPDVGRVLAAWGQPVIRSKEWRGGSAGVSGGILTWVLYAPEDGTEPRCVDAWLPFQFRWDAPEQEGVIRSCCLLRFVDGRAVSARKIMVRAGVGCLGQLCCRRDGTLPLIPEVPPDVHLKKETFPLRIPREAGEKAFLVDEVLSFPAGAPVPQKLMSFTAAPECTDRRITGSNAAMKGLLQIHTVYVSREDRICCSDLELPFSQLGDLDGTYGPDATLDVIPAVTSLEMELQEDGTLRIRCGVTAQYLVFDRLLAEIVTDAYSSRREVSLGRECLELPRILEQRQDAVAGRQLLPGVGADVAEIFCLPDFPVPVPREEGMGLEIPTVVQVLYYDEAGVLQGMTGRGTAGLQLSADDSCRIEARTSPACCSTLHPTAEGMEILEQIPAETWTLPGEPLESVTALELSEEKEPEEKRPSLVVCRFSGEELWDIAKRCGSTVEAIRQANGLEDLPEPGQIMLVPVVS